MSRRNLFISIKKGGVGLVHLFLRHVDSRFIFLRDQTDPFLRTVVQTRLVNYLPDFVVSSSALKPRAPRGYLKEVVMAFQFLEARFSYEYLALLPRKKLYKDVIDVALPVPVYRSLYCAGTGKDVLRRVNKCL